MGDIEIIKILLAFGAYINALGYINKTPIGLLRGPLRVCSRSKSPLSFMAHELPGIKESFFLSTEKDDSEVFTVPHFCESQQSSPLNPQLIEELISLLESAGAERKLEVEMKKHPRYSITLPAALMKRIFHEPREIRYQYNFLLDEMIKKCLGSIGVESQSTEDKTDLMRYMRESRALQMAGSRILFLDGGGMRGLIQVGLLSQVYTVIKYSY